MIAYKGVGADNRGYYSGFDTGVRYELGKTYQKNFELSEWHGDGFYFGDKIEAKLWAKKYKGVILMVDVDGILGNRAKIMTVIKEI